MTDHKLIVEVEGGQVIILGHFNLFALDGPDRMLLEDLAALVEKHRTAKDLAKAPTEPPETPDAQTSGGVAK